jgi:hypothetical protein
MILDAISRLMRRKANNETERLLQIFEDSLNTDTEDEFIETILKLKPSLSDEQLAIALKIFRENSRS